MALLQTRSTSFSNPGGHSTLVVITFASSKQHQLFIAVPFKSIPPHTTNSYLPVTKTLKMTNIPLLKCSQIRS